MKLITLTKGRVAQVDDEDFNYLNQWKWTSIKIGVNWYAIRRKTINKKAEYIYLHRLIMDCKKGDGKMIDHRDRNGLNCQKDNMRFATHSENRKNKAAWGSSKWLGVNKHVQKYLKKSGEYSYSYGWLARIVTNKVAIHLGYFKDEVEAAKAYNEAAKKYHGEFANLNVL